MRERVEGILREKLYYFFDSDGRYDWLASVKLIAANLGFPDEFQAIKKAIEDSFTPDSLTVVFRENNSQPLIQCVSDLGLSPCIWTVGDSVWQRTKFEKCGIDAYVGDDHFKVASVNKIEIVDDFITSHSKEDGVLHLYVVDDKSVNLEEVMRRQSLAGEHGVQLHSYHLKLGDPKANPTAFYQWLQRECEACARRGERMELFLDMDGVVIDTDATMYGPAVANIERWLARTENNH